MSTIATNATNATNARMETAITVDNASLRETYLPDPIKRLNKLFECALCGSDQPGPRFSTCACHKICSGCAKGKDLPYRAVATRHADKKLCPVSACHREVFTEKVEDKLFTAIVAQANATIDSVVNQAREDEARAEARTVARAEVGRATAPSRKRFRECTEEEWTAIKAHRAALKRARTRAKELAAYKDDKIDAMTHKLIDLMGGEDPFKAWLQIAVPPPPAEEDDLLLEAADEAADEE